MFISEDTVRKYNAMRRLYNQPKHGTSTGGATLTPVAIGVKALCLRIYAGYTK